MLRAYQIKRVRIESKINFQIKCEVLPTFRKTCFRIGSFCVLQL